MKFRKKPVVVEAEQFLPHREPLPFAQERVCLIGPNGWYIETLEGPLCISNGDWIVKGVKGEFYLCKPDIFEQTYEPEEPHVKELRWAASMLKAEREQQWADVYDTDVQDERIQRQLAGDACYQRAQAILEEIGEEGT